MAAVQSTHYCRTCRTVRLVVADVRTVAQPYAAQVPVPAWCTSAAPVAAWSAPSPWLPEAAYQGTRARALSLCVPSGGCRAWVAIAPP